MSEWISVKERLPEGSNLLGIPCIVVIKNHDGSLRSAYRPFERKLVRGKLVERWLYPWDRISDEEVLYWMPLPEPPEDE